VFLGQLHLSVFPATYNALFLEKNILQVAVRLGLGQLIKVSSALSSW
jgi:hypothetical protein